MSDDENVIKLPISRELVRDEIARIAKESSQNIDILDHAMDRMEQRDITLRQITNVLKNGEQVGELEWCIKGEKGWRCSMNRSTAGGNITVVAKLVERNEKHCLIVTTWKN